jgi:ribosomal protein S19
MGLNDRGDRKTISTDNNRIPAGIKDIKTASRFSAFTVDLLGITIYVLDGRNRFLVVFQKLTELFME